MLIGPVHYQSGASHLRNLTAHWSWDYNYSREMLEMLTSSRELLPVIVVVELKVLLERLVACRSPNTLMATTEKMYKVPGSR